MTHMVLAKFDIFYLLKYNSPPPTLSQTKLLIHLGAAYNLNLHKVQ